MNLFNSYFVVGLVNVCLAFIALMISGSSDTSFPAVACFGWFVTSLSLIFVIRKEVHHG